MEKEEKISEKKTFNSTEDFRQYLEGVVKTFKKPSKNNEYYHKEETLDEQYARYLREEEADEEERRHYSSRSPYPRV